MKTYVINSIEDLEQFESIRKLKFRGYDKNDKQMYFGSPVYLYSGTKDGELDYLCEYITGSHLSKDSLDQPGGYDFEIMQFTGLLDKHGKEIYEGDIVKCVFATGKEPCKVIQEKGCFWVSQKGMKYLQTEAHDNLYWHNSECEVIGNIYENPELLNVKQ